LTWAVALTTGQHYRAACDLVCTDPLVHLDRTPKTRSLWPTLLGFYGILENAYICISSASNWPVVTKFALWVHLAGMQQMPGILPTFRGDRVHNRPKAFDNQGGTNHNRCTQRLVNCNLVCADPLAHPNWKPQTRSPWQLTYFTGF